MQIEWMKRVSSYDGHVYYRSKPIKGVYFEVFPHEDECSLYVYILGFDSSLDRDYTTLGAAKRGAQRIINKFK